MTENPRKKKDWVGRKVRLLQDLENQGGFTFPRGSVMAVTRSFGGLWLEGLYLCTSCSGGRKRAISKIPESKVELLPVGYEETFEERKMRAGGEAVAQLMADVLPRPAFEERLRVAEMRIEKAKKTIMEGLKYHEHDGHSMPKLVARAALAELGIAFQDQHPSL